MIQLTPMTIQKFININTHVMLFMVAISIFFPTLLQPWWDICFFFTFSTQIAFMVIYAKRSFCIKKHEYVFISRVDLRNELIRKLEDALPPGVSKEIKDLSRQFFGTNHNRTEPRVFPSSNASFDDFFFKYKFKCIHCENIITLPPHLLKSLPKSIAMCPYGIRVKFKELIVGFYNCLLEEEKEEREVKTNNESTTYS